jgi:hypothetical protein
MNMDSEVSENVISPSNKFICGAAMEMNKEYRIAESTKCSRGLINKTKPSNKPNLFLKSSAWLNAGQPCALSIEWKNEAVETESYLKYKTALMDKNNNIVQIIGRKTTFKKDWLSHTAFIMKPTNNSTISKSTSMTMPILSSALKFSLENEIGFRRQILNSNIVEPMSTKT